MLLTVLAGEGSTKSAGHHFHRDCVHSADLGFRNFEVVPLIHRLVVNISFISSHHHYNIANISFTFSHHHCVILACSHLWSSHFNIFELKPEEEKKGHKNFSDHANANIKRGTCTQSLKNKSNTEKSEHTWTGRCWSRTCSSRTCTSQLGLLLGSSQRWRTWAEYIFLRIYISDYIFFFLDGFYLSMIRVYQNSLLNSK